VLITCDSTQNDAQGRILVELRAIGKSTDRGLPNAGIMAQDIVIEAMFEVALARFSAVFPGCTDHKVAGGACGAQRDRGQVSIDSAICLCTLRLRLHEGQSPFFGTEWQPSVHVSKQCG
jgi:hypothetical protein